MSLCLIFFSSITILFLVAMCLVLVCFLFKIKGKNVLSVCCIECLLMTNDEN